MCGTASCSSLATMLARSPSRHKRKCRLCDPLELPLERRNAQTTNSREHCAPRRQQASQWVGSQERRHATQGRTGSMPRKGGASADGREPAIASSPSAGAGRPNAEVQVRKSGPPIPGGRWRRPANLVAGAGHSPQCEQPGSPAFGAAGGHEQGTPIRRHPRDLPARVRCLQAIHDRVDHLGASRLFAG